MVLATPCTSSPAPCLQAPRDGRVLCPRQLAERGLQVRAQGLAGAGGWWTASSQAWPRPPARPLQACPAADAGPATSGCKPPSLMALPGSARSIACIACTRQPPASPPHPKQGRLRQLPDLPVWRRGAKGPGGGGAPAAGGGAGGWRSTKARVLAARRPAAFGHRGCFKCVREPLHSISRQLEHSLPPTLYSPIPPPTTAATAGDGPGHCSAGAAWQQVRCLRRSLVRAVPCRAGRC